MNMAELKALKPSDKFSEHLDKCYEETTKEHSDSWTSWAKTRFRSGNQLETFVNASGQAGGALGIATGGVAAANVAVPGAMVGAGLTSAALATAITLYALPATITIGALGYWGYNKSQHHKVNKDIWEFWRAHSQQDHWHLDPGTTIKMETAKEWLGWFGDEGISNMNHLGAKLREAQTKVAFRLNDVVKAVKDLEPKITAAKNLKDAAQQKSALQKARQESDALAQRYYDLGKDIEYVRYRLQRLLMYSQILDLTVRTIVEEGKVDLAKQESDVRSWFSQELSAYRKLWLAIDKLPAI